MADAILEYIFQIAGIDRAAEGLMAALGYGRWRSDRAKELGLGVCVMSAQRARIYYAGPSLDD